MIGTETGSGSVAVPKHWAEDFFDQSEISPQEGDEELFVTIQLLGIEKLVERFGTAVHKNDPIEVRAVVEKFCEQHHKNRPRATRGVWVRYEIWIDSQRGVDTLRELGPF
jgi:hypothetical protein